MLEQILDYIHNYFVKEVHSGKFTVYNGELFGVDFLLEDQYYKIEGSVFNDGIHQHGDDRHLKDEEFEGTVSSMAVPPALLSLTEEIQGWVDSYGSIVTNPYISESFGGYSYSKASGSGNGSSGVDWRDVFKSRLNRWRKIS